MCGVVVVACDIALQWTLNASSRFYGTDAPHEASAAPQNAHVDNEQPSRGVSIPALRQAVARRGPDGQAQELVRLVPRRHAQQTGHAPGGGCPCQTDHAGAHRDGHEGSIIHLFGSLLQLRGSSTAPSRQPLKDRFGNVLLFNGEIFEGPAARPVRPGENDAEVLLAVLATCVVVNDSAVASNDGMTRDSIITDRSAVTSNSTMASGSTMASDSAVTGDSNNPMADHNAEAVGGAHLNDSCIMPKGPERSREAHPLDGGDPPPLSPYPTVPDVLSRLRGPWALVYWQAAARTLWVARDAIGRRSLLMHAPSTHDPRLIVSSVAHPYADDGTWGEDALRPVASISSCGNEVGEGQGDNMVGKEAADSMTAARSSGIPSGHAGGVAATSDEALSGTAGIHGSCDLQASSAGSSTSMPPHVPVAKSEDVSLPPVSLSPPPSLPTPPSWSLPPSLSPSPSLSLPPSSSPPPTFLPLGYWRELPTGVYSIRFDGAMEVDVPGGTREGRAAATGVAAVVGYDASKVAACDATGCGAVDVDALVRRGLLAAECTGCVDVTCPGPQVAGVGAGRDGSIRDTVCDICHKIKDMKVANAGDSGRASEKREATDASSTHAGVNAGTCDAGAHGAGSSAASNCEANSRAGAENQLPSPGPGGGRTLPPPLLGLVEYWPWRDELLVTICGQVRPPGRVEPPREAGCCPLHRSEGSGSSGPGSGDVSLSGHDEETSEHTFGGVGGHGPLAGTAAQIMPSSATSCGSGESGESGGSGSDASAKDAMLASDKPAGARTTQGKGHRIGHGAGPACGGPQRQDESRAGSNGGRRSKVAKGPHECGLMASEQEVYDAAARVEAVLDDAVRQRVTGIWRAAGGSCAGVATHSAPADMADSRLHALSQPAPSWHDGHPPPVASVLMLFSGGVDSMVLAALAHRHVPLEEVIDLANVSFDGPTSPDRITGLEGVRELCRACPGRRWRFIQVDATLDDVDRHRAHLQELIFPCHTYMDINIAAALWLAADACGWAIEFSSPPLHPRGGGAVHDSRLGGMDTAACASSSSGDAPEDIATTRGGGAEGPLADVPGVAACSCRQSDPTWYRSPARVVIVGSGVDEQCAGYGRHRTKFRERGWPGLYEELQLDVGRLWRRNLGRDDRIIADLGREARFPFLAEPVMSAFLDLPLWVIADPRLPPGHGEKRIIRQIAKRLGLSNAATLPKRAIQFGSRIAWAANKRDFGSNRAANLANAGSVRFPWIGDAGSGGDLDA